MRWRALAPIKNRGALRFFLAVVTRASSYRPVPDGGASMATASEVAIAAADPTATWQITDHICRHDFGRVLVRTDADGRRVVRCADCAASAEGGHDTLCMCGADTGAAKTRLRCERQAAPSAEFPSEIIAVEAPL
jgi:hypothetical protein